MKCQICGKNYISVGVHIVKKHGVTPDEYRHEFGLLKTAALIDEDLSGHLSKMAKIRSAGFDDDERAEVLTRLRNSPHVTGEMSEAGKALLRSRNIARNDVYVAEQGAPVGKIIESKKTAISVRRAIGMGHQTVLGMAKRGLIDYDKEEAEAERLRLVAVSIAERQAPLILKVVELYDSKLTLREICRQVGIGLTTYKRWRSESLVPNRKTYLKGGA